MENTFPVYNAWELFFKRTVYELLMKIKKHFPKWLFHQDLYKSYNLLLSCRIYYLMKKKLSDFFNNLFLKE